MTNLDQLLSGVKTVGICAHVRPDGDAFGSCMGMYIFLKQYYPQIEAKVYLENTYSQTYTFVSYSDEIISSYPREKGHDLFISLDVSDRERLGRAVTYFDNARTSLVIDHHISNKGFGMINEIQPDASSTCEIVALMIGHDRLTRQIAEPLYMGIVHDTGMFQFSCTSSRTMMVGGWLMDTGIAFNKICNDTFFKKTYEQNLILGKALIESVLTLDGKVIYSVITRREMDFFLLSPTGLDAIIQQLRVTDGVEVAVFLYEIDVCRYKVSMRSNGFIDVAKIALHFSGGGHQKAAGCTINGRVPDIIDLIVGQISEQLSDRANRDEKLCGMVS